MQDGGLRRITKRLALVRYRIDLAATRCLRGVTNPVPYRLGGACRRCGACCETPMIQLPRVLFHFPRVRRAVAWWHRILNGFELIALDLVSVEAPSTLGTLIGLWEIATTGDATFANVALTFMYDAQLASELALNEANLGLFQFEDGLWSQVSGFSLDTVNDRISGTVDSLSLFAIGVDIETLVIPEPTSLVLTLGAVTWICTRRRRASRQ